MAGNANQALIWRIKWLARRLDWRVLVGALLSVLAVAFYFYSVKPLESRLLAVERRWMDLQDRTNGRPKSAAPVQPKLQLADFYGRLPDVKQAPEIASQLHVYATNAGLTLERGEYRPQQDASGKFIRYQIVLPVNGSYPQVRRFLGEAMRDVPGLALDGITFRREAPGSSQLQAELRFTAFLRRPT
jgi:Tfp pilus assembly protein PilO